MHRERPPGSAVSLRDLLVWTLFLLPAIAAAPQQQPQNAFRVSPPGDALSDTPASIERRLRGRQDSLSRAYDGQRGYRDTYHSNARTSSNERALATFAPAGSDPAVRAPPARSSATRDLHSRHPARSLQDWQVEDIILLATVDGKIHARDRKTGAPKWQLEVDRPMVETVYHRQNKSHDEGRLGEEDPLWIVEPSQDGSIYVYAPGSGLGMQKLGYTVKQLVELSPYAGDGMPAVAYTAEKKNTLYTVDAGNGNILKSFSSSGSTSNQDRSCRRVNPLETLDDEECEPVGTLILGRTEYTIGIQDRNTGEEISTIRYFEWGPNNRDQDLRSKYTSTMDKKYVYSKHDGTIFGMDLAQSTGYVPDNTRKPMFRYKLSSPVARVYDLVRPFDDESDDVHLVVLPQPIGPLPNSLIDPVELETESVYVNCTESGSWFAMSETNYPTVTEGAARAMCENDDVFSIPSIQWPLTKLQRERFAGIHHLSAGLHAGTPLIGEPEHYPRIDAPVDTDLENTTEVLVPEHTFSWSRHFTVQNVLVLFMAVVAAVMYQRGGSAPFSQSKVELSPLPASTVASEIQFEVDTTEEKPMVREAEPAKETIFPLAEDEPAGRNEEAETKEDGGIALVDSNQETVEDIAKDGPGTTKKKATRGKRGGRKQKEKEQAIQELKAQQGTIAPAPTPAAPTPAAPNGAEIISVDASESSQISGPIKINSLVINKDRVIGHGSAGTCVFEGSFEGRDVAVKRMLSQYYELAAQEVSFLQQSDDHPNVIRYFCQQKDSHFLYIAVELCQASLWDLYNLESRDAAKQEQLSRLRLDIQRDIPRALQQLAAGLFHLHNLRIIHRDIKPQNILIAFPKRNQTGGPRLVISDFGLGKTLPENVSTLIDATHNAGTSGWKAPELISQPKDSEGRNTHSQHSQASSSDPASGSGVKRAADIFSLGCLFFWVLTGGCHPFDDKEGWTQMRELNIKKNQKNLSELQRWGEAYEPMELITSMLEHLPESRPTALQVLNHPFFWPAEKRLQFLVDMSDHFERECRDPPTSHLLALESRGPEVISGDFLKKLDWQFVETLGKQRKYTGDRMLDLLRALRNKKNHYEDMPEKVKERVGALPEGYLMYWTSRFPRLLMGCYEVVHESGLQQGDRFRGYFTQG